MSRPILPRPPAVSTTQPVGFWRQIFLALSFMLGPGVFVGMGIAIEVAGVALIGALTLAALLALLNASDHQTDDYLLPAHSATLEALPLHVDWQHFIADWMLFLARLTVAATAVLGLAAYGLKGIRLPDPIWLMPTALVVGVVLSVAARGRPSLLRFQITALLAIVALMGLILAGFPALAPLNLQNLPPFQSAQESVGGLSLAPLLQAGALMSVAYAGNEPLFRLPRPYPGSKAVKFAIVLAWLLYLGVAVVSLSALRPFLDSAAGVPVAVLSSVLQTLTLPGGIYLITIGAVAAMAGTVIHLLPQLAFGLLQLSQSPAVLATGQPSEDPLSPQMAKLFVGIALGCIVLVGDVKAIWSFSAFAFLLHAALMHWIALRQATPPLCWQHRFGFIVCLFLAFWLNWDVWLVSLGLVALALIWRGVQYWSADP